MQTNPQGPSSGSSRVLRGGSWSYDAYFCRVSYRYPYSPDYINSGNYGFRLVLLPPVYSDLKINTTPMGAAIYIDGKNYGVTPKIISKILTGEHELKLEKEGYNTVTKKIKLEEKNMLSLEEKLEKGVKMTIKTDKTGDRIFVNNDYMGLSPVSVHLPYGMNKIKAERNGETVEKEINVLQDARETVINLTFKTENKTMSVNSNSSFNLTIQVNGVFFEMVYVKGDTFWMGAQSNNPNEKNYDSDAYYDERPIHQVSLSDYYIGKFEVSQGLWKAVMGSNPSVFTGDLQRPVERVSWNDCQHFIRKLNQMTGKKFALPTEAQWEFAARGGNKSRHYKYSGSNNISTVAWYEDNSADKTHPIGRKHPNELGIYDMSGNVWEWCADWYGKYDSPLQLQGTSSDSHRILRGGCWYGDIRHCRVSNRSKNDPDDVDSDVGFRLVLVP